MTWARARKRHGQRGRVYLREPVQGTEARLGPALAGAFAALVVAMLAVVVSDSITVAGAHDAELAAGVVILAAALLVWGLYIDQQRRLRKRLIRAAYGACGEIEPGQAELDDLAALRACIEPLSEADLIELERAYCQLVENIVADGVAEPHELDRLRRTEAALDLPAARIQAARVQGFLDVYDAAIEDQVLTEDEEETLDHIREALAVPERLVKQELAFARQLSWAREARTKELVPAGGQPGFALHKDELVVHMTTATWKKRVMRIQVQGSRETREHVFEPTHAGTLYVSNQRLVFEAAGISSMALDDICEVGIEAEHKHLMVVKSGRKSPYYFEMSQPYVTLAYLERVLETTQPD